MQLLNVSKERRAPNVLKAKKATNVSKSREAPNVSESLSRMFPMVLPPFDHYKRLQPAYAKSVRHLPR